MPFFEIYLALSRWASVYMSILGCLTTISIYVTLGCFDGVEPPNLPFNLTLHSIAAAEFTIATWCIRTSIVLSSTSLCWYYMKTKGTLLRDFALLLDLAGSPIAVFRLAIYSISSRHIVALLLIGNFMTNEVSHFATQQSINTKVTPYVSHNAKLPRAVVFDQVKPSPISGLGKLPRALEYATATAMFEEDSRRLQVSRYCPGKSCSWRSSSLEIHAQCSKITHLVVARNCKNNLCESYTLSDGPSLDGFGAQFSTSTSIRSLTFPEIKQPLFTVRLIAKQVHERKELISAYECVQYPRVVIYETHETKGYFSEIVVEEWRNKTAKFPYRNPNADDSAFIALEPGGNFGPGKFTISEETWITSQYAYIQAFRTSIKDSLPSGNQLFAKLLKRATLNGTIEELIAKHALAQTTFMREHDSRGSYALGTTRTYRHVFDIQWAWLTLPLVTSVAAVVLSIVVLLRSFKAGTFRLGNDAIAILEAAPREQHRPLFFRTENNPYQLDLNLRLTP